MKNVLLFVFRNRVFFLFLLLELACISLIVRNNQFHQTTFLSSSNRLVGNIYELNSSVTAYFGLRKVNENLAQENAALRSILMESRYSPANASVQVADSSNLQNYTYLPVNVVNNSTNRRNNYLTINKGILQGVEPEMAVISSGGIVGIVKDVSKNFASVISILHKNSSTSARLKGNGYFGSLIWDGRDPQIAQLTDIPSHVQVLEGMEVETSGFSSMFPRGIKIGEIDSYEIRPGDNFYSIDVKLSARLNALSVVYVVTNLMRTEQTTLEEETQTDDE
ncbi:MAG: rod shape-determining protein MreC [Flavobacteriales bacterium]|jgi:rod shape-determining protein MreC|nr:rod shape-determining protein MreC [Flavobacteriales bacterium]